MWERWGEPLNEEALRVQVEEGSDRSASQLLMVLGIARVRK